MTKNRNIYFIFFIAFFFSGIVLFFTLSFFMGGSVEKQKCTDLTQPIKVEDGHTITPKLWQYSPNERTMQLAFSYENAAADGNDIYIYYMDFYPKKNSNLDYDFIIEDAADCVFTVKNIPQQWSKVQLRIKLQGEQFENIVTLHSNIDQIETVESISQIQTKTDLFIFKTNQEIEILQMEIESLNDEIHALKENIKNLREANQNLTKNIPYQTSAEIQKSNNQIEKNKTSITASMKNLLSKQSQISDLETKIENLKENIKKARENQ